MKLGLLLSLGVALLVGYGVELAPYYVRAISGGGLAAPQWASKFETTCDRPPQGSMKCTQRYDLPIPKNLAEIAREPAMGLGIFISATEIYCRENPELRIKFGDIYEPARALELLKVYQVVDLSQLQCKTSIIVDVWSPAYYRRSGHVGAPFLAGDRNLTDQTKRVVEFFASSVYLLLAFFWLFYLAITRWIYRSVETPQHFAPFDAFALSWGFFALARSGLPEILIPAVSASLPFVRASNFLSLMAHGGPIVFALARVRSGWIKKSAVFLLGRVHSRIPVQNIAVLTLVLCVSPWFAKGLSFISVPIIFGSAWIAIKYRRPEFFAFAFLVTLELLKLQNFYGAPYGVVGLPFVTAFLAGWLISHIKFGAELSKTLHWAQRLGSDTSASRTAEAIQEFASRFDISRVTLYLTERGSDGTASIYRSLTNRSWSSETKHLVLPSGIFSHVISTQEPLWDVDENSDFSFELRPSKRSEEYSDALFSVFPITFSGEVVGAISLTDYGTSPILASKHHASFKFALTTLISHLAKQCWNDRLSRNDQGYRECLDIAATVRNEWSKSIDLTAHDQITLALRLISARLQAKAFVSRLNWADYALSIEAIAGFDKNEETLIRLIPFRALPENQIGPMPLSIHRNKIVTVADMSMFSKILHGKSQEVIERTNCKSASAIPLSNENRVWGVLWIQSSEVGRYSSHREHGLRLIQGLINEAIQRMEAEYKAKAALKGLVTDNIAERLLRGASVREEESGFLVVLDVRGSSRIANLMGADVWKQYASKLGNLLNGLAREHGLAPRTVVWDAFSFTMPAKSPSSLDFNRIEEWSEQAFLLVQASLKHLIESWPGPIDSTWLTRPARICVEFGDITRDISDGTWTIVGASMANVSKMEAECKKLSGWMFTSATISSFSTGAIATTGVLNPATGIEIHSARREPKAIGPTGIGSSFRLFWDASLKREREAA